MIFASMATKKSAPKKSAMSASHKKALANGRTEGRAIRDYLEVVEAIKPRRGRRRTPSPLRNVSPRSIPR